MERKNFLFVSLAGLIGDIAWQIAKEGHNVKYYIDAKKEKDIADGFVPIRAASCHCVKPALMRAATISALSWFSGLISSSSFTNAASRIRRCSRAETCFSVVCMEGI